MPSALPGSPQLRSPHRPTGPKTKPPSRLTIKPAAFVPQNTKAQRQKIILVQDEAEEEPLTQNVQVDINGRREWEASSEGGRWAGSADNSCWRVYAKGALECNCFKLKSGPSSSTSPPTRSLPDPELADLNADVDIDTAIVVDRFCCIKFDINELCDHDSGFCFDEFYNNCVQFKLDVDGCGSGSDSIRHARFRVASPSSAGTCPTSSTEHWTVGVIVECEPAASTIKFIVKARLEGQKPIAIELPTFRS
ncbi:hypothetical protein BKA70DRAFT_1432933 [Coprinopsis sp. MPI-PUGE-AT-0042]|nr:hypothetical protein BKA70DRAFT_1432933 [Coprinopsis sp. MPI-PUGE-AT-0042]